MEEPRQSNPEVIGAVPEQIHAVESPDGVDLTLIQWMLSLTPLERIELLQDWVDGLAELRNGRVAER